MLQLYISDNILGIISLPEANSGDSQVICQKPFKLVLIYKINGRLFCIVIERPEILVII